MANPTDDARIKQSAAVPVDGGGNPVTGVHPGEYGKIKTFTLLLEGSTAGATTSVMKALADYDIVNPTDPANNSWPQDTEFQAAGWMMSNYSAQLLYVSGDDAALAHGMYLAPAAAGVPGTLGLIADLAEVSIHNPGVSAVEVKLTVIGKGFKV